MLQDEVSFPQTEDGWVTFLQKVEIARHYKTAQLITSGLPTPNPILEFMLPSLLLLHLTALLEDMLSKFMISNSEGLGKSKYRDNFDGNLRFLNDEGVLSDFVGLDELRKNRNRVAHENYEVSWQALDDFVSIVHAEALHLGFPLAMPKYEFFAERGGLVAADDPKLAFSQRCSYGLKLDGRVVLEVAWTENIGRLSQ